MENSIKKANKTMIENNYKKMNPNNNMNKTKNSITKLSEENTKIEALGFLEDVENILGSTIEQQIAIDKYRETGAKITYDSDGNAIVNNTRVNNKTGDVSGIIYTIDRKGRVIKMIKFLEPRDAEERGEPIMAEIIYNSDGSSIEDQYFKNGTKAHIERYSNEYIKEKTITDANGRLSSIEEYRIDGTKSKITRYYYDKGYYTIEYPEYHDRFYYDFADNVIKREYC